MVVELEDCRDARSANRWSFELADDFVYEFLRLQADHNWESTRQGVRGFGMIGGLNGVLLLARGFQLLPQRIRSRPTEGDSQCPRGRALRAGLFRLFRHPQDGMGRGTLTIGGHTASPLARRSE